MTTSSSAWSMSRSDSRRSSATSIFFRRGRAPTTSCPATRKRAGKGPDMKPTLKAGLTHRLSYKVPENKTVPYTYPESPEISAMPKVFATGFMIVLMEWACTQLLAPHLDPGEGSLGVHHDRDGRRRMRRGCRFIVMWDKFNARLATKVAKVAEVA